MKKLIAIAILLSFINVSGFGLVDAFAGVQSPGGPCSGDSCQPGDANADGFVNLADEGPIILDFRGTQTAPGNGDCNGDGFPNLADLGCVITVFRNPPPTPTPIPGSPTPTPIPGSPTPTPIPGNPTPTPTASPTPTPTASPTPTPTASPTPTPTASPTPTPTPFPDCPVEIPCISPDFDMFDNTTGPEVVRFCEQQPAEDGGLVGEVTSDNTTVTLISRILPSLQQFSGGPGFTELMCTVDTLDPTICDPVGHLFKVFPDSGGEFSVLVTGGTIFLTNGGNTIVLMDIVTTDPQAPPVSASSTCCTACELTL
ncbi:hypothetical protein MYX76_13460 [Desulfobacterota bacterium AH_259_B03_O07]|nr:hypothetical protein [Desulfobacterota bacterium AH_259_B03_O07]